MPSGVTSQQACFVSRGIKVAHQVFVGSQLTPWWLIPMLSRGEICTSAFPLTVTLLDVSGFVCMRASNYCFVFVFRC